MGNKRSLAAAVALVCQEFPSELPLVDLFGGMCNVAGAVADSGRAVHVNDVQCYAELAARCLIASPEPPPASRAVATLLREGFEDNRARLHHRFAGDLRREEEALSPGGSERMRALADDWRHAANDTGVAAEVARLAHAPSPPSRLCTLVFSHGYFGLAQSIDIDSVRFAIDKAREDRTTSASDALWLRLALLQTASRVAATPGHFAQYLRPASAATTARITAYRRRPVWEWFLRDVEVLRPYGTMTWRRGNSVSRRDALELAEEGADGPAGPAIFYADPPYSKEHYSRFYHVLETLERYDYPIAVGVGRYRPDRFRSDFAVGTIVRQAMDRLFAAIAGRGGRLLFSYPSSGLLITRGGNVRDLLESHFGDVRLLIDQPASHSTLGARHGSRQRAVREQVWLGE